MTTSQVPSYAKCCACVEKARGVGDDPTEALCKEFVSRGGMGAGSVLPGQRENVSARRLGRVIGNLQLTTIRSLFSKRYACSVLILHGMFS